MSSTIIQLSLKEETERVSSAGVRLQSDASSPLVVTLRLTAQTKGQRPSLARVSARPEDLEKPSASTFSPSQPVFQLTPTIEQEEAARVVRWAGGSRGIS